MNYNLNHLKSILDSDQFIFRSGCLEVLDMVFASPRGIPRHPVATGMPCPKMPLGSPGIRQNVMGFHVGFCIWMHGMGGIFLGQSGQSGQPWQKKHVFPWVYLPSTMFDHPICH